MIVDYLYNLIFLEGGVITLKLKIVGSGGMSIIPSSFCKCKNMKKPGKKAEDMND